MANRIEIVQGNGLPILDTIYDSAGNLVTATLTGVLNIFNPDGSVLLTKTASSITSSIATFTILSSETANFPAPSVLKYETVYTYTDGEDFNGIDDVIQVKRNNNG